MKQRLLIGAGVAALLLSPGVAFAQRTNESALTSAQDAFGTSVGNEKVGLYSPVTARGFSPVQAGNVRINGLYFDYQTGLNDRLMSGNNVRVGLTAQGYPFPAPTGVADFSLRLPGSKPMASVVAGVGPYLGANAEIDAQLPITETLGVAAGVGVNSEEIYYGGDWRVVTAAAVVRWRASENLEVIPFWMLQDTRDEEAQPIIYTAGAYLPARMERRRYFGPDWARNESQGFNYGLITTWRSGDWTVRAGGFRSVAEGLKNYSPLFLNATLDGRADRDVIVEHDRKFASTSGEVRVTREFVEGDRLHMIHLMARGRAQDRRNGGGQRFKFGRGAIEDGGAVPEPAFTQGAQTTDEVRQLTAGLGYEGRWRDVGELTLGVQRTSYEKAVVRPAGPLPVSQSSPWLFNGALSLHAGKNLVVYAGYSKGLEESPVAPDVAINRGEAPPAIITEQMDAGFRTNLTPSVRLVTGVFDVRKPYFALDPSFVFRELGERRHRGVEVSLTGQLHPRVNVVLGAVAMNAKVSGDAVDLGLIGPRPIGSIKLNVNGAMNWSVPWVEGLSVDLTYEGTSDRVANAANTFVIPARYAAAVGARYRFEVSGRPALFRAQLASFNNAYGYNNQGEGFFYNLPRRFQMSLTVDL